MKRIDELDGIRGLAILLVLIWHYFTIQIQAPVDSAWGYLVQATQLTWSGVDLFFVLSGFLIGGILLDNRHAENLFKTFFIRRACRIFPLYFVMVAGFILLSALAPPRLEWLYASPLPLWSYLSFTQNYLMGLNATFGPNWLSVTWAVAMEQQFYVILPCLIRLVSDKRLPLALLMLILFGPIYRHMIPGFGAFIFTFARTDSLMMGVLLAYLMRKPAFLDFLKERETPLTFVFAGVVMGAGVLTICNNFIGNWLNHFWLAVLYTLLILLVILRPRWWISGIFRNRMLAWLGLRSYGIFLLHQPISGIWHGLLRGTPPAIKNLGEAGITLLALASTLLLSEISFRFLERPFVELGHTHQYLPPKTQTTEGE
jgi:peptidoglycan/LPS O-acetylase OafA/YrhL